ncbi:MAG TPA: hypothetical protein V6D26_23765 [Stenomitos sp.]
MKKIMLLLTIAFGLSTLSFAQTQTVYVKPKGVFEEIDVARQNGAVEILNGNNKERKQQTVDSIVSNPNFYIPPVIYALSRELFNQDKKDDAMYWFYVAQLRARYDANLCMDISAKQAVSVLNGEYGPDINRYAFQDIDKLEKTVTKVVDFVRANEESYDHRWINLHGMEAVLSGMDENAEEKELSQPKDKWAEIKKKTLDDYYNGFIELVESEKLK